MSDRVPGKVIYIGSIPYDQTEQQVLDIAKSIGPVVNLKMMFDKETGRSKGFAFIEYKDVETASSAVRNLNNYSIGNRQLKCDFSTENSLSSSISSSINKKKEVSLPPLPAGVTLTQDQNYQQVISQELRKLDPQRLQTLIRDSQIMAQKNPIMMEELLSQCPQLSYALVEALLMSGKGNAEQIQELLLVKPEQTSSSTGTSQEEVKIEELDDDQKALIRQVIEISDEDLIGLPDDQKEGILQIKENYKKGVYGLL